MPKIYKATKRIDSFHIAHPLPGEKHHQRTIVLEQGFNDVSTENLEALRAHPMWLAFCAANGVEIEGDAAKQAAPGFVAEAPAPSKIEEANKAESRTESAGEIGVEKSERQIVIEELKALGVDFNEDASLKKLKELLKKAKA